MDEKCPECDSKLVTVNLYDQVFNYGTAGSVLLTATQVPLLSCNNCDFKWTDWRGEEIRDNTVKRYLEGKK